jgi:hypothetical protein
MVSCNSYVLIFSSNVYTYLALLCVVLVVPTFFVITAVFLAPCLSVVVFCK